jgi:hypothetical protein
VAASHATDFRLILPIDVNPLFRFLYRHMNYHIEITCTPVFLLQLRYLNHKIAAHLPKPPVD